MEGTQLTESSSIQMKIYNGTSYYEVGDTMVVDYFGNNEGLYGTQVDARVVETLFLDKYRMVPAVKIEMDEVCEDENGVVRNIGRLVKITNGGIVE